MIKQECIDFLESLHKEVKSSYKKKVKFNRQLLDLQLSILLLHLKNKKTLTSL